jgi:4-hydroxy-tetrahydrodipicolinate synthase
VIDFGSVLTAMVTPFRSDGSLDYGTAERLASHLVANGTDTLVICGTTGESPTLTWEEEYELFRVIKAAAGQAKVMAGTGSNSTREAIHATTKATELGLDGSLQVVPYYNKPPQEGLYAHFKAIAEACPTTPLMLYNIPGRTGQNMLPETIARLAEIPNIVAIKEASGSLDQVSQVRSLTPPEFGIYSGDDSLTLPMLSVGARGVVSVASHLVGPQIQTMIQAYQTGKPAIATQIHLELLPLFKALFVMANPIPIKAALSLLGWPDAHLRLPLIDPPASLKDDLRPILQALKLLP